MRVDLNGRKFGNSFSQFTDATLEIGPRGVTPFSAGLCAPIKPHIVFGKILKNLQLDRTKDNLGSPQKFSSNPSKTFDELLPWRGKGAQIQIQEEIEIVSKPSIVVFFRPSLQVIGCRHDQIMDCVGVWFVQQRVLAKQLAAFADIFIIRTRTAILFCVLYTTSCQKTDTAMISDLVDRSENSLRFSSKPATCSHV